MTSQAVINDVISGSHKHNDPLNKNLVQMRIYSTIEIAPTANT